MALLISERMTDGYDQAHLERVLADVYAFFKAETGLNVALPDVEISTAVKDSAWYDDNGVISINPEHNPEELDAGELVAHEFFHHVQNELFWKKMAWKPEEEEIKKINELMEGTAFLFAAVFIYHEKKNADDLIKEYMSNKKHMTKSGVGNALALRAYRESNFSMNLFVKNITDYALMSELFGG